MLEGEVGKRILIPYDGKSKLSNHVLPVKLKLAHKIKIHSI